MKSKLFPTQGFSPSPKAMFDTSQEGRLTRISLSTLTIATIYMHAVDCVVKVVRRFDPAGALHVVCMAIGHTMKYWVILRLFGGVCRPEHGYT